MNKLASFCAFGAALAAGCGSPQTGSTGSASTTGGTTTGAYVAGAVSTLAGNGTRGDQDGSGGKQGQAEFSRPEGVAADTNGNVFVADTGDNCVRMIDPSGNVTTLENSVSFVQPSAIAVDSQGYAYVTVALNYQVWKINASGASQILAGNGQPGDVNGLGGPDGPAEFFAPTGVAVDAAGNVYVADHDRVRKIGTDINVSTLAGNGTDGYVDGPGGQAEFSAPRGLAVDGAGNIYVADSNNNRIRKIDPAGNVTTLAGNGIGGYRDGSGGPDGGAQFYMPSGVAVDANDNVFVADTGNELIRRIDSSGNVTTWAGIPMVQAFGDATDALEAGFANPYGLGLMPNGGLVVSDEINNSVRLIAP
jgi:serine/threonine protein kinase, bacterial